MTQISACLPTPNTSAVTKRYLTEREKKKEHAKMLSTTPPELRIHCIWILLIHTQVSLSLPYRPPLLFEIA